MLTMRELREKIMICTEELNTFSTTQLKELLNDMGCIYNTDYDVTTFSNAISSLVKQKYIASLDNDRRGNYKIIKKDELPMENKEHTHVQELKEKVLHNDEPELAEMRANITSWLNSTLQKIEKRLDKERPSIYVENIKTCNDIAKLIKMLKEFEFTIKDK